jgi:hypothetical protein
VKFIKDPEFEIFDYEKQVIQVISLVAKCKTQLTFNTLETIPYFNEIMNRELDAIIDTLTKINHFHASARCARAALELTLINLYGHFHSQGSLLSASFKEKYGVKKLTHKTESPILELVENGVLDQLEFDLLRESYSNLSNYVHSRETYHLFHTLPHMIKSEQYYADVLKLAGERGNTARIVKATLINYSLKPGLETLLMFLKIYERVKSPKKV